jgi:uncharacterized Rossmann fold enzyme
MSKLTDGDRAYILAKCLPVAESLVAGVMTAKQIMNYIGEPDKEYVYPDHYIMAVRKINGFLVGGIVIDSFNRMSHE